MEVALEATRVWPRYTAPVMLSPTAGGSLSAMAELCACDVAGDDGPLLSSFDHSRKMLAKGRKSLIGSCTGQSRLSMQILSGARD